jgi:hypothetical protein
MGAILSIPMTLIFKELIFEADDQNRWIATLMSAGVSAVAPERLERGEFDGANSNLRLNNVRHKKASAH